jgi:DNA-binding NtrC family response regulator
MKLIFEEIAQVAPTDTTVLIEGESGTGKELVARAIHALSMRREGPYLPLNCGAVAPNLVESELFGHEKGAFTGASQTHTGHFERASGGTLFLDEITEMPPELQVKLLRVLETGTIVRIGGKAEIEVDVRVVAATNQSPEEAIAAGRLREDLYYRINVFRIEVPPLRARPEDIELLSGHFLAALNKAEGRSKKLNPEGVVVLKRRSWPGNVRELKNTIERAFILAEDEISIVELEKAGGAEAHTPPGVTRGASKDLLEIRTGTPLDEIERRVILATLEYCEHNKTKTAETLGISLKTLYNRLNAYKGG